MIKLGPYLAILLPLLFGLIPSTFLLRKISQKHIVSISYGFISLIIFIIGTLVGAIISGYLNPEVYADFGDNPGVMRGCSYGLQIGLPILLYFWFRYRLVSKKKVKNSESNEE